MRVFTEVRMRSRVGDGAVESRLKGRILQDVDYEVLLTGPARIVKPDGQPLCVYVPGAVAGHAADPAVYEVLHSLRVIGSDNRGAASGSLRIRSPGSRSYARRVRSAIVGAADSMGQRRYCRLTAWTGTHIPEWEQLQPLLRTIAEELAQHVPDRYAAQLACAQRANPAWIVPGTPFSTVTVNNTYPTGVHKDKGDLEEGFSAIAVVRRGELRGGRLVFPAWRVAVDLQDGDLILMDAHDWHGNTAIVCACGARPYGPCESCGAQRISVVAYFRTRVADCESPEREKVKALQQRERAGAHGGRGGGGQ